MDPISRGITKARRYFLEKSCAAKIKQLPSWPILAAYLEKTNSTGCSFTDYWYLYETIRQGRHQEVLECGTGVSTIIIAIALQDNEHDLSLPGRVTSMEEKEEWFTLAGRLLPAELQKYVDLRYSPKKEYTFSLFRGVGYADVPERPYTLVFVDGPGTIAPSDGTRTFNFDYINVVRRANVPVLGLIDKRLSTCFVYAKIFGNKKIRYDEVRSLGIVGPCLPTDIREPKKSSSAAFSGRLKTFGRTLIDMDIERD
jgi:hypothetical protein